MGLIKTATVQPLVSDERKQSRDWAGLLAQLDDAQPTARRWAARDLADFPNAATALVQRLQIEADASVREVILSTLTTIGDEVAVAGLMACLGSEEVALRNEALEAMKQLPDAVAPIMGQLLHDPRPDVRIFAVNILEILRHPAVESWLIEVIDTDPALNVCATAVDLLGEVGTGAAQAALQRLKARFADEPYIRFATDLALQRIAAD